MRIVNHKEAAKPTLREVINRCDCTRDVVTFQFDGHLYVLVSKTESGSTTATGDLRVTNEMVPCFNLKCHTLRGMRLDCPVEPVNVEIHVHPRHWSDT